MRADNPHNNTMELLQLKVTQDLVDYLLAKGILLSPEHLAPLEHTHSFEEIKQMILAAERGEHMLSEEKIIAVLTNQQRNATSINLSEQTPTSLHSIDSLSNQTSSPTEPIQTLSRGTIQTNVQVIYSYRDFIKKREVKDFVNYLNNRYHSLANILMKRDLPAVISISKIYTSSRSQEEMSIIGMVYSIEKTKNGHYVLELEDPSGKTKVLLNKNREDVFSFAKDIVLDEVLAITGIPGDKIFFANKIYSPDVPVNKELKRSPDEVYAAFISDLQIGSRRFMHDDFMRFIDWMHGKIGNEEQRKISTKTKYLFVVGDIVDGVGIYPGQENELTITNVYDQYRTAAEYLSLLPKDVHIILIPGNHDAMRLSDPQPPILKRFAPDLWNVPNVTHLSSPGIVRIHQSKNFPGFEVHLYHGFSVFYYADVVERLREAGGADRTDLVLKFFLQKRHLAPSHGSNLFIPDIRADPMIIEKVPDFLVCGHVHRANAITYRNVTLISCSCWDGISDYSLKFGGHPLPGRVPIVNLQTRQVKIMKFTHDEEA